MVFRDFETGLAMSEGWKGCICSHRSKAIYRFGKDAIFLDLTLNG